MLIVNLDSKNNLEKALKTLKNKVIKTKQTEILKNRKEFTKKSVDLRNQKLKAIYIQSKITNSR
jgi:small subunit ribosomal protein S21